MISLLFISCLLLGHQDYDVREYYTHQLMISDVTYAEFKAVYHALPDPEIKARLRDIAWHKWTVEHFEKFADYEYYESRSFNESLALEQFNIDFNTQ